MPGPLLLFLRPRLAAPLSQACFARFVGCDNVDFSLGKFFRTRRGVHPPLLLAGYAHNLGDRKAGSRAPTPLGVSQRGYSHLSLTNGVCELPMVVEGTPLTPQS